MAVVLGYLGVGCVVLALLALLFIRNDDGRPTWTPLAIALVVLAWPFVLVLLATFGLED